MSEIFEMRRPDDFHLHLREARMLNVVSSYLRPFGRALVMPNTNPPILDAGNVRRYRNNILKASHPYSFEPLMTIQIVEGTRPGTVFEAKEAGAVAGKVYPRGMTTNSENGVLNYRAIYPALEAMQKCGMRACFHGESPDPDVFCLDRETRFLKILKEIAHVFPGLKIVLEHVTTAKAVECVTELPGNVAATITVHHLFLTLDDVVGGKLHPHHFCKPVAKRPEDRAALREAAMSGNPKFFFGSDSAPHLRQDKECASGCAGVFTVPVALSLLVEFFERYGTLNRLEDFCSSFGADFYGVPRSQETIRLVRDKWVVPQTYNGIVPFRAGEEIAWRVE